MKVFIVTGMHRSATSLLAKGLHEASVSMGSDFIGPDRTNPWGHFEDREPVRINDLILLYSGGSWKDPPDLVSLTDELEPDIQRYIEARSDRELWGFKDPRLCVTWPAWLPTLRATGADLHVMAAWRTPEASAESLRIRDGMPHAEGVKLARKYHAGLVRLCTELDRSPK